MTGLLNPKSSDKKKIIGPFLLRDSRRVSRQWDFSSGVGSFVFLQIVSLGEVLSSQIEEPQKKKVVHLYRSTCRPVTSPVAFQRNTRHVFWTPNIVDL